MSHPLLLRLFQSEHFGPRLAVSYLYRYPDHVGISYYLCDRLREASPREIEFFLPQLCHLLISTPTESGALEAFLLERCDHSTHTAMLMLWLLQAHLADLRLQHATQQFAVCRRVFNRVQNIIFGVDAEVSLKYSQSQPPHYPNGAPSRFGSAAPGAPSPISSQGTIYAALRPPAVVANKVHPNIPPALVGMSVVMSGIGLPSLAKSAGQVALAQGRRRPRHTINTGIGSEGPVRRKLMSGASGLGISTLVNSPMNGTRSDEGDGPQSPKDKALMWKPYGNVALQQEPSQTLVEPNMPGSRSLRSEVGMARKYPHSSISLTNSPVTGLDQHPKTKLDGIGRRLNTQSMTALKSSKAREQMTPPFAATRRASTLNIDDRDIRTLPNDPFGMEDDNDGPDDDDDEDDERAIYDQSGNVRSPSRFDLTQSQDALHRLLKGNYLRLETQFILQLQDIATRLIIVPKAARLSALRAELTMLNNNLPAEVCIPLWCPADRDHSPTLHSKSNKANTDDEQSGEKSEHTLHRASHHRVVRISPSDAVVLNSADRAPYLLCVEVLNGDLSFDPLRRQNQEKIEGLIQEQLIKSKRSSEQQDRSGDSPALEDVYKGAKTPEMSIVNAIAVDSPRSLKDHEGSMLHNGLSGLNLGIRSNTPSPAGSSRVRKPSVVLEGVSSPAGILSSGETGHEAFEEDSAEMDLVEQYSRGLILDGSALRSGTDNGLSPVDPPEVTFRSPGERAKDSKMHRVRHNRSHSLGEDDYAERMRTAAIMLAQLNATSSRTASLAPSPAGRHHEMSSSENDTGTGAGAGLGPDASQRSAAIAMKAHSSTITGGSAQATAALARAEQNKRAKTLAGPEAEDIRKKIIGEMIALEERRMRLGQVGRQGGSESMGSGRVEDELRSVKVKDDPSGEIFRESWTKKRERIRAASPYGHLTNWDLFSVIVKTGADLRQEQLACQIIEESKKIFDEAKLNIWLRPFRILVTSDSSGLVETITDSISIHSIKKDAYAREINEKGFAFSLLDHFVRQFGPVDGQKFKRAQDGFMRSLAGYSLVCYLLQIKDRHNGNILLDHDGRLVHIDFGFMLSNTPGSVGFEMAPFKLPQEYIDILGGIQSSKWEEFRQLMHQGFKVLRRESERIVMLVECLMKDSKMPCFVLGPAPTLQALRERFQPSLSDSATNAFVDRLILSAAGSYFTRLYDQFQYYSQGVL